MKTSSNIDWQLIRRTEIYERYDIVLESLRRDIREIRILFGLIERSGGKRSDMLGALEPFVCELNDLCFFSKQDNHKS